ncbi:MAG: hypothetical protein FJW39_28750 [Acidobacteria bacterium]|nr:hypothetical protein [Acidobacteriota bacterium]
MRLFVFLHCCVAGAATLEEAANDLARRVNSVLAPREVCFLRIRTLAQVPASDVAIAQRTLQPLLRTGPAAEGRPEVVVSLSQNQDTRLIVAEVRRGSGPPSVFLAPYAGEASAPAVLRLERTLLWQQAGRILDAAPAGGGLLVMDPDRIAWALVGRVEAAEPLVHASPLPRDARGHLRVEGTRFTADAANTRCTGEWQPALKFTCEPANADPAWPLVSGRNHFQPAKLPPVFSFTPWDRGFLAVTTADQARWFSSEGGVLGRYTGWGTVVASLPHPCAQGRIAVAGTSAGAALQAFDPARPLSEPVSLNGVVAELWPSQDSLTAIVQQTGNHYAAYRITVACGR